MSFFQDVRFGFRILLKSRGFTLVAILALALGIGVNSMMFTIYNAVLFKSLPFEKPEQVVHIENRNFKTGATSGVSYRDLLEYREQARSLHALAAMRQTDVTLSDDQGVPERLDAGSVTANTFALIGQQPMIGRDFRAEDERPDADPVAIISYSLWQTRYGADHSILGKTVRLNGRPATIVGIMPRGMEFPENEKVWQPIVQNFSERQRTALIYQIIGRLHDSVSVTQAQAELSAIGNRIAADHSDTNQDLQPFVESYLNFDIGPTDRLLLNLLMGAVSFVLLIACANVANLLLARAIHRTRETAIRSALGASRWRVIRQLLVESVLLGLSGGIFGLGFAIIGVKIFTYAVQPVGLPYWFDFSMDRVAFLYLLAICVSTGILFGLAPAFQLSRANLNDGLKETGRGTSGGVRSRRLTGTLVAAEITLTFVLMVGAALMVRSLLKMEAVDIGVKGDNMISMTVALSDKYAMAPDRIRFMDQLNARLGAMPGLDSFTIASQIPGRRTGLQTLNIEGRDLNDLNGKSPVVATMIVTPGYFKALDLTMIRGREFAATDGAPGSESALVNQRFAAQYWPGEDPVGKRIQLANDGRWATVVGVSPRIVQWGIRQEAQATAYLPYRQSPGPNFNILVKTRMPTETVVKTLRKQIAELDPDLPLFDIRSIPESIRLLSIDTRILSAMFSIFALIGLILASVGIYAVAAYSANQRTQEIGVRIALGAGNRQVLWLVLRSGLTQLALALPIGLAAAFGVTRLLRAVLFQVSPLDPLTFVAIPVALAGIVFAACLAPAWRAARLNPVDALRTE